MSFANLNAGLLVRNRRPAPSGPDEKTIAEPSNRPQKRRFEDMIGQRGERAFLDIQPTLKRQAPKRDPAQGERASTQAETPTRQSESNDRVAKAVTPKSSDGSLKKIQSEGVSTGRSVPTDSSTADFLEADRDAPKATASNAINVPLKRVQVCLRLTVEDRRKFRLLSAAQGRAQQAILEEFVLAYIAERENQLDSFLKS